MILVSFISCDNSGPVGQKGNYKVELTVIQRLYTYAGYNDINGNPVYVWKDVSSSSYEVAINSGEEVYLKDYPATVKLTKISEGEVKVDWISSSKAAEYTLSVNCSTDGTNAVSNTKNTDMGKMYMKVSVST